MRPPAAGCNAAISFVTSFESLSSSLRENYRKAENKLTEKFKKSIIARKSMIWKSCWPCLGNIQGWGHFTRTSKHRDRENVFPQKATQKVKGNAPRRPHWRGGWRSLRATSLVVVPVSTHRSCNAKSDEDFSPYYLLLRCLSGFKWRGHFVERKSPKLPRTVISFACSLAFNCSKLCWLFNLIHTS